MVENEMRRIRDQIEKDLRPIKIVNTKSDPKGDVIVGEFRGTEEQIRNLVPDRYYIESVLESVDEPTLVRIRPPAA